MRGNFIYGRLGIKLARARSKCHLSQEETSHRCGIDRTYLSRIETGKVNPSLKILCNLCKTLKIRLRNLMRKF